MLDLMYVIDSSLVRQISGTPKKQQRGTNLILGPVYLLVFHDSSLMEIIYFYFLFFLNNVIILNMSTMMN